MGLTGGGRARRKVPRSRILLLGAAAAALAAAPPAAAQEEGRRTCTLVLNPATDSTRSTSVEVAPDRYVTYVWNGLGWTCGNSRMVADSAVRNEPEGWLRMIGSVDYRDSVRTLLADTVTYFERDDRIVARGEVSLTRRATGSTLDGPVVEFLRAVRPGPQRTVATGRPHMSIHPDTAARDTTPPVEVDADSVVLMGDREARAWGDVRIRRPDLDARADSAFFQMEEGEGRLFGSPVVTGEGYRLSGHTIRTRFHEGELEEVEAVEDARASGESFQLFAPRILARLAERRVERLWATGEGRVAAFSEPYRLGADSLEARFAGGQLEELDAVGDASAVEVGEEMPEDPFAEIPLSPGDRSWVAADTLHLVFAPPDSTAAAVAAKDTAAGAAGDTAPDQEDRRLRTMRAVGGARAYHLLQPEEVGDRPARHYQRGQEIVVRFREGEAHRILGRQAIGVHLDPVEGAGPAAGADTAGPAADTSGAVPDTVGDPPAPPPDTSVPPPDSARAPPDTAPPAAASTPPGRRSAATRPPAVAGQGRTRGPRPGMPGMAARNRRPRGDPGGRP